MTQRQITLSCLRLALSGSVALGDVKDMNSSVNLLLRIVVGDRVKQEEVAVGVVRAPNKNMFRKLLDRVEAAISKNGDEVLDDAELRLECLQLAFAQGCGLRDVEALQSRVDEYAEIVAGQSVLPATKPGNPKKRARGPRRGSG